MKYLNNKFYTEVNHENYIINDGEIFREAFARKSLKSKNEFMNHIKLEKNITLIELGDGSLQIVNSKKKVQTKE